MSDFEAYKTRIKQNEQIEKDRQYALSLVKDQNHDIKIDTKPMFDFSNIKPESSPQLPAGHVPLVWPPPMQQPVLPLLQTLPDKQVNRQVDKPIEAKREEALQLNIKSISKKIADRYSTIEGFVNRILAMCHDEQEKWVEDIYKMSVLYRTNNTLMRICHVDKALYNYEMSVILSNYNIQEVDINGELKPVDSSLKLSDIDTQQKLKDYLGFGIAMICNEDGFIRYAYIL